jgi:hypothetical protein
MIQSTYLSIFPIPRYLTPFTSFSRLVRVVNVSDEVVSLLNDSSAKLVNPRHF